MEIKSETPEETELTQTVSEIETAINELESINLDTLDSLESDLNSIN
jgi:hypothetical protein